MQKVKLYIVSLWLLFALIAVKEFKFVSWDLSFKGADIYAFVVINWIFLMCILFLILGGLFYWQFNYQLKGSSRLPITIKKIEDQSFEHLTFLTTYIIPFLRVKLESRDLLVSTLLLIIIGAIFVKTNLFYKNPTLALLGYRLYKVDTATQNGLIFISKECLKLGDVVHNMHLSDNIYFVKNEQRRANSEA